MSVLAAALRCRHPAGANLLGGTAEITVVAIDDGADSIAEIAQQVPSVGYLDRFRRALADPIGVGTSTVARDYLDPGMLTKPIG